jgi:hypothetical protein
LQAIQTNIERSVAKDAAAQEELSLNSPLQRYSYYYTGAILGVAPSWPSWLPT